MLDQTDISAEQRECVKAVEQNVDALLAEFAAAKQQSSKAAKQHITNDARLSPEGKQADVAKLRQDYAARLKHITDNEVSQIAKRLAEMEVQLRPQRPDTDAAVQFLKEQEIRAHLRTMDELQVIVLYQDWVVTGKDDDSMRATEGAPAAFPLISHPSVLKAGKAARAARHNPQATETLKRLRQMQGLLRNIVRSAEAQIGLPADDMLAVIAKGEPETTD